MSSKDGACLTLSKRRGATTFLKGSLNVLEGRNVLGFSKGRALVWSIILQIFNVPSQTDAPRTLCPARLSHEPRCPVFFPSHEVHALKDDWRNPIEPSLKALSALIVSPEPCDQAHSLI